MRYQNDIYCSVNVNNQLGLHYFWTLSIWPVLKYTWKGKGNTNFWFFQHRNTPLVRWLWITTGFLNHHVKKKLWHNHVYSLFVVSTQWSLNKAICTESLKGQDQEFGQIWFLYLITLPQIINKNIDVAYSAMFFWSTLAQYTIKNSWSSRFPYLLINFDHK